MMLYIIFYGQQPIEREREPKADTYNIMPAKIAVLSKNKIE